MELAKAVAARRLAGTTNDSRPGTAPQLSSTRLVTSTARRVLQLLEAGGEEATDDHHIQTSWRLTTQRAKVVQVVDDARHRWARPC